MDETTDPARPDALPPLNALRSFRAVARLGSLAAAAIELSVTHWAVGKQVRLLEDWFGVPLFERHARGVTLTDDGTRFLDDVVAAFDRLADGATRVRQARTAPRVSGQVHANVLASFALCWLLPRLAGFQARYPDIDVRVSTTSRKLRTIGGAFDIGVRSGYEVGAGFVASRLMADLRLPACSPALLRRHPIQGAADLRHHSLLHSASTRASWSQWLRMAGQADLRPARHVEFEHVYLQWAAAIEGLGVTLASLPMIQRDLAAGRLVCPLGAPAWQAPDYTLVVDSERASDPAVMAFEAWMRETVEAGEAGVAGVAGTAVLAIEPVHKLPRYES
jgi:LysR family glycine cleavage system transcriptional activator